MPCIDGMLARPLLRLASLVPALALGLAGCVSRTPLPAPPAATVPASAARPAPASPTPAAAPPSAQAAPKVAVVPAAVAARAPRYVKLPPPPVPRSWDELRLNAARRLVAAHPDTSYMTEPPATLLGIPVLEIELNGNGSVRRIRVVREPRDAKETIQMAIDAVHRAAPYGDVSRLPKPWSWREVFLFDDDHRFKPAILDR